MMWPGFPLVLAAIGLVMGGCQSSLAPGSAGGSAGSGSAGSSGSGGASGGGGAGAAVGGGAPGSPDAAAAAFDARVQDRVPTVPDFGPDLAGAGGPRPGKVLIFYGRSGIGPAGLSGYSTFQRLQALHEMLGLKVDYTDNWPADLSVYRLVILVVPGSRNQSDRFSPAEVAALSGLLAKGGTILVQNEKSTFNGTATINDLLAGLASVIRQENASIGSGGFYGVLTTEITPHPLLEGVDKLGFGDSARVLPGTATSLVRYRGETVLAVENIGAGALVVSGDTQFVDNHALATFPPDGGDNLVLARHLAGF